MKIFVSLLLASFFLLSGSSDQNALDSENRSEAKEYVITIESNEPGHQVNFVASYVFGDGDMVIINEQTPYQLISSGPHLTAMIQSDSSDEELKVDFHENIAEESIDYRLSGIGRTFVFGSKWSENADKEMEIVHYVTGLN